MDWNNDGKHDEKDDTFYLSFLSDKEENKKKATGGGSSKNEEDKQKEKAKGILLFTLVLIAYIFYLWISRG